MYLNKVDVLVFLSTMTHFNSDLLDQHRTSQQLFILIQYGVIIQYLFFQTGSGDGSNKHYFFFFLYLQLSHSRLVLCFIEIKSSIFVLNYNSDVISPCFLFKHEFEAKVIMPSQNIPLSCKSFYLLLCTIFHLGILRLLQQSILI